MQFDFKEFTDRTNRRTDDEIHVTINKIGRIFLNKHAVAALGNPDGIALMYDERRRVIGLKGAPVSRDHAYLLWDKKGRPGKLNHSRVISAADFCKHHNIAPEGTLAFKKPEVSDGVLVLDLNEVRTATKKSSG